MVPASNHLSLREKQVLTGFFLSKFDTAGLAKLGMDNFTEAFNVIGFGLGGRPASIKNYRDEFDPLFPNPRMGWHKRQTRDYCLKIVAPFQSLDLASFAELVQAFVGYREEIGSVESVDATATNESAFAKRLMTGLAAEHYFEAVQSKLPEFADCELENTTQLGCGYDFRLHRLTHGSFWAIEVKGLTDKTGSVALTPKEHSAAHSLTDRFFLFVVKNFREKPFHEVYRNPLSGPLGFVRKERVVVQVTWQTSV